MIRRLTHHGWLLNPLDRRHASTQWIRSHKYLSVKYHSASSPAIRDDFSDEIPQPPTPNPWLFQIPTGLNLPKKIGVPLPRIAVFLKHPIDWEAVEKILKKRPALASIVGFGCSEYRDLSFLQSLAGLGPLLQQKKLCTFKFERMGFDSNGPSYMRGRVLTRCHLTCNLPKGSSTLSDIDPKHPVKITAIATKDVPAQNAAILQLLIVLEERQLLDVFLSRVSHARISNEAREALQSSTLEPSADPAAAPPEETTPSSSHVVREVFNYAASYLYIPKYTVTFQPRNSNTSKKKKRGPKEKFTVEISLTEHGIHASATGISLRNVEDMACVIFKQEVEKYHIANAVPSHSSNGPITLSTGNARNFMDFYNDHHGKVSIKVVHKDNLWTGQAFTGGSNTTAHELGPEITRKRRDDLEELTMLVAAIILVKERPQLLVDYKEKLDSRTGKYLSKAHPVMLQVHQSNLSLMQSTVKALTKLGLSSTLANEPVDDISLFSRKNRFHCSEKFARERSDYLLEWWRLRSQFKHQNGNVLPINRHSSEVLSLIENNQYSILVGQTGSGKTTQLPQIILDEYIRENRGGDCKIVCTQPRRIAATSVARRVAKERGQNLGDQVGYHVRSDPQVPKPRGSITYCTTGIIVQQLIHDPDNLFDNLSHLVIDEVHERGIDIDTLLTMVRDIVKRRIKAGRSNPRVCFMSATVDAEMFQEYFSFTDETVEATCKVLHVEGRAFPVEEKYLEDIMKTFGGKYPQDHAIWSLLGSSNCQEYLKSEKKLKETDLVVDVKDQKVESVIEWDSHLDDPDSLENQMRMDMEEALVPVELAVIMIGHIASTTEDGAILLFLPGLRNIVKAERLLRTQTALNVDFNDERKFKIFQLHSSISEGNNDAVFKAVPPGCRKIILATNVAETSITINDVQYVVDTGKHKETNYHQMSRIWSLPCKWISKSSVKQRAGRAGRVQNGNYYALFSKLRYKYLRTISRPEIDRVDLQEACLNIKALGHKVSIQDFFAGFPNPPSPQAVHSSIGSLKTLGALTDTENLTPLGRLLGRVPLEPALGKMVLLGTIYRCLDPMIILGALENEILQQKTPDREHLSILAMRWLAGNSKSDHIAMLNAFRALRTRENFNEHRILRLFADQKFLNLSSYYRVKNIILGIQNRLKLSGLVPNGSAEYRMMALLNENSKQNDLVKALLVQGLYPHIGTLDHKSTKTKYQIVANEKILVSMDHSSINHPMNKRRLGPESIESSPRLLSFSTLALASDNELNIKHTTAVNPFVASLFSGTLNQSDVNIDRLQVDQWLPFDVRCLGKISDAEGAAAQTILRFNNMLRQWENKAFRDLVTGEYDADSEMSRIVTNSLKVLLAADRDLAEPKPRFPPDGRDSWHSHSASDPTSRKQSDFMFKRLDLSTGIESKFRPKTSRPGNLGKDQKKASAKMNDGGSQKPLVKFYALRS
ncbi:hypothetical protein DSL72_006345 [Monilinia vaccinii-corymbosi]|uniref:RNA helicase n=1 Tax=Monilinia vaccinii-corymbosi TaxID=61207 RepID=A0A8A3PNR5_9HELO|nr:hypothetical protein DSL72_006345 [Monilinia vaccinii-corymbosi]